MSKENTCKFCFEEFPSSLEATEHRLICSERSETHDIARQNQESSDRDNGVTMETYLGTHPFMR